MPGIHLHLSSLSLTSATTLVNDVCMDPALWGTLPDPLVELIVRLVHFPLPSLLPMIAVCMKLNELLQTPKFLTSQRQVPHVQCPAYVLTVNEPASNAFSFFQTGPELFYLRSSFISCPITKYWFNMSLDFLPVRDFYVTSVSSGLLCFVAYKGASGTPNRKVVLGVCNPASRSWRILPHWGDADSRVYNLPTLVAMVVDNFNRSYKIVVIDHDRTASKVYHSGPMAWTETESVPCRHSFPFYDRTPTEPVVRGATLVCATQCKTGIATYDFDTGLWETYHVFLPGCIPKSTWCSIMATFS